MVPAVKLLGGMLIVCALLAVAATDAAAVAPHLPMHEARSEAQSQATDFTLRRDLDESHVGRCHRRSARKISCGAVAQGETQVATIVCHLHIRVRLIRHRFYDSTATAITKHRCAKTRKERLTYKAAFSAIQSAADSFGGVPATISYMFRRDDLNYSATARWERASVPPSEWEPTESCSVELLATLAAGKVSVVTEGFSCY